ncbi:MAG: transglycosylase domain-containing protein [Solibacillus sp.]
MKQWLEQLNKKIEAFSNQSWMRYIRITSGVFWNLALLTIIIGLALFIFVGSVGAGYFASLVKDEPLRSKEEMRSQIFNYEETSEIYFANDVYIGKLRTDLDRRETSLSSVSPYVINAVLATEDEYFREHKGIVPKAVLRGLLQDVTNSSTQTGGSTLTQQLIKNQILTNEVSYERKAKEILLAYRLEHFMTKEEILEAYLNVIPYGRNASGRNIAGIETAANGIFGITAADLTLPQAAYIAGIPQAPFKYTPFSNKGELKSEESIQFGIDRMKTVLYRMNEVGFITDKQYNEAIAYDITQDFSSPEERPEDKYPWLTVELESRSKEIIAGILAEKDGVDPKRLKEESNLYDKYIILADRAVRSNGYRIYSTIDKDMYDAMNESARNFKYYGHTYKKTVKDSETGEEKQVDVPVQVGGILLDNKTGKILSFVAGRDYKLEALNHATQAYRSNGSTMKPLLAYGPALEYGVIGAGSPVVDVKFTRSYDNYSPTNYTPTQELGIIPARRAVATSQNLTALRLYNSILDKRPAAFLEKMGFSRLTDGDYVNLSTTIGGLTHGATVEENTNAYTTFANDGKFIDAYMIERIEDLDGNIVYEHKVEPVDVFSAGTAYMMTDMLRDVYTEGTATHAKSMTKFSSDFAVKTGTTQEHKDVWLVGYNPNITLGVWLGYDQPRTLFAFNNTYNQPSVRVNRLWASLMNSAYDINPEYVGTKEKFKQPESIVSKSFCGISGLALSNSCQSAGFARTDLFNKDIFIPTKLDNSFNSPTKYGFNQEFINRMLGKLGGDPTKLVPSYSNQYLTATTRPKSVQATLNGQSLTWTASTSLDVVSYRVYNVTNGGRTLVTSVAANQERHASIELGASYVVVAVNEDGKESTHSNKVGSPVETPAVENTTEVEQPAEEAPTTEPTTEPATETEPATTQVPPVE